MRGIELLARARLNHKGVRAGRAESLRQTARPVSISAPCDTRYGAESGATSRTSGLVAHTARRFACRTNKGLRGVRCAVLILRRWPAQIVFRFIWAAIYL